MTASGDPVGRRRLGLIWAEAENGVIGLDGAMPWRIPEDLIHFKSLTLGCAVIMGRRTWESLPPRFRPLEGRDNIVLTRQRSWRASGATVVHELDDAERLACRSPGSTTWVIGGAELYRATIDRADLLEITEIDLDVAGDTIAPVIASRWREAARQPSTGWNRSSGGVGYRFVSYEPRRADDEGTTADRSR